MAPLALTRGDPSGIGPELALKAWLALHDVPNAPAFFVVANAAHLEGLAKRFALPVPIAVATPAEAAARNARRFMITCGPWLWLWL